jgi:hypothetical protein
MHHSVDLRNVPTATTTARDISAVDCLVVDDLAMDEHAAITLTIVSRANNSAGGESTAS